MGKFSKVSDKIKQYNKIKALYKKYFDDTFPGWEETEDANHIKMRIDQATSKVVKHKNMQKTKVIKKVDYKGEWPFKSDEVTICKYGKLWITCFINGKEYALNGLAQETMPYLKFVHDAKKAIKGKDIGPFIKIGQGL